VNIANCYYFNNELISAENIMRRVVAQDEYNVIGADILAAAIRARDDTNTVKNINDLNRLSHQLIKANNRAWQTWTCVAFYCDLKGDKKKALSFTERALNTMQNNPEQEKNLHLIF